MNSPKAFTLVELIVVISIISLVSYSGIFYFQNFTEKTELNIKIENLKNHINDLNKKVNNYDIYNYSLILKKDGNHYITSTNNISENKTLFSLGNNGLGLLSTTIDNGNWNLKFYKNYKKSYNQNHLSDSTINYNFIPPHNYVIKSKVDNQKLNNILINYLGDGNFLKVIDIIDESNNSFTKLEIINKNGKLTYTLDEILSTEKIYLIFKYKSVEKKLLIN